MKLKIISREDSTVTLTGIPKEQQRYFKPGYNVYVESPDDKAKKEAHGLYWKFISFLTSNFYKLPEDVKKYCYSLSRALKSEKLSYYIRWHIEGFYNELISPKTGLPVRQIKSLQGLKLPLEDYILLIGETFLFAQTEFKNLENEIQIFFDQLNDLRIKRGKIPY